MRNMPKIEYRRGDLNPYCLSAPAPKAGVSANSTTPVQNRTVKYDFSGSSTSRARRYLEIEVDITTYEQVWHVP